MMTENQITIDKIGHAITFLESNLVPLEEVWVDDATIATLIAQENNHAAASGMQLEYILKPIEVTMAKKKDKGGGKKC